LCKQILFLFLWKLYERMKKLDNLDIRKFYFNKKLEDYQHEERLIKTTLDASENISFWLEDKEQGAKLKDIITNKDRIVLLGNPGIGKTKELENLFKSLWNEKDKTELVPFFLNIKIFKNNNSFEELIKYDDWQNLDGICFIIDGLDEIPDIESFLSALELFLERNDEKNIKIIVSCRTNIYEKFSVRIEDSEYFYLQNLTDKQIRRLLSTNFNVEISYQELNKYRIFLENPFNLNLFGNFYKENGRFPNNISEAFELSISKELNLLNKEKFKKIELLDIVRIEKVLQKTAITSELMQKNGINEKDLYSLLGKDEKSLFEKISFIEKIPESASLIFRHKNYQEFLAAKYISELETDKIIDFIKINDLNKTVPSLLNTISFLINMLKDNKLDYIKKWLLHYEPEILFLIEKEELDNDFQKEIFRKYFNEVTVQKTFWISMDRRFSLEKIAEFADIDYLLFVIKENEYHARIIKSAFDVLNYCKPNIDNLQKIKSVLNLYIFSDNDDYLIDALQTFGSLNFHVGDKPLFLKICEHLKNNESKDVHYRILFMFKDFDNIDDYFEIFKISLNIECKMNGFERSNATWFLEEIILKTKDPENFLEYYKILFNGYSNLKLNDFYNHEFEEKLKEKTLNYVSENNEIIIKIFDLVFDTNQFFSISEEYLFNLFIECNGTDSLFKHIVENYGITTNTISTLALTFEESLIPYIIQKLNAGSLIFQDGYNFEMFRNRLSFSNRVLLAEKFEKILVKNGYKFNEKTLTIKERNKINKNYQVFCNDNFEILFNEEIIIDKVNKFFDENNIEQINFQKLQEIRTQWYKNTGYHNLQNSTFSLIQRTLIKDKSLKKEEVVKQASDIYTRLLLIRNKLDNSNSGIKLKIEKKHINWIRKECTNYSLTLDFQEIDLHSQSAEEFEKFNILKVLLYFDDKFSINYSQKFYLNILQYCNVTNLMNNNCFDLIKNRINDLNIFNKQIIENLNNDSLNLKSLKVHIEYTIKNKLSSVFSKIKEIILEKFESVFYEKLIEDFISVLPYTEKIEFSKSLINTNLVYLQWKSINFLKTENLEKLFLIDFCKKYLDEENEIEYNSSALDVLFKLNDDEFLEYFYKSILQIEEHQFLKFIDIYGSTEKVCYTLDKNNFNLLKPIFFAIYRNEVKDSFAFQNAKQLFQSFIIQQSKNKNVFIEIKNILFDIKKNIFNKKSLFFYINLIIDECEQAYYNSISKPLNIFEAKVLIENIENPIQQKIEIVENHFNFKENSTFKGNQFGGENNTQTNNFNSYSTNSDVLKAEEILKEFQQLKIENDDWKNIFIDGMKDLIDLKEADTEVQAQKPKTQLRRVHDAIVDFGKKTNDWKNLAVLPVEFHDKIPKLIELGNHLSKFLGF